MTMRSPNREKYNAWRLIQRFLLAAAQSFTLRFQVKGVPRVLYAIRWLFLRPDETYTAYRGIKLRIGNNCQYVYQFWNIVNYGGYEIVLILERLLREGDLYVDVGANIGYMAVSASRAVGADGLVLAVEPEPRMRAKLLQNVELNCANNVRIIPMALGDEIGTTHFSVATEEGLSRIDHGKGANPCMVLLEKIEVAVTTLDALVEELAIGRHIRLVKIDVEGYEYAVFKGAAKLLQRATTIFIFESNPGALAQNGVSLVEIHSLLTDAGYEAYAIKGHTADWFRLGRFPTFEIINNPSDYSTSPIDVIAVPRGLCSTLGWFIHS